MKQTPFIAIEGPIGVGKTTLTYALTEHFSYNKLQEIVYENPFLGKFYDDTDAWGFQTEMFFLANRIKQLEDIKKDYLDKQLPVIADYHIIKNLIFARQNLNPNKFVKFNKIYDILLDDLPKPNLLIILNGSLKTLKKHIFFRGREFEMNIEDEYLSSLIEHYQNLEVIFKEVYPDVPVFKIDVDEYDIVNNQDDLNKIIKMIEEVY